MGEFRKELKAIGMQDRHTYTGTFERTGIKRGYQGRTEETILLLNVKDKNDNVVANHLWFSMTKGFAACELSQGDTVLFDARVDKYNKGYYGHREDVYRERHTDYKLSRPTKIKVIQRANKN